MYITNPQPGTTVQCPNCSAHVIVNGRALHRWVECPACGQRTEWHEQATAPGVNCRCHEPNRFCPMHGRTKKLIAAK